MGVLLLAWFILEITGAAWGSDSPERHALIIGNARYASGPLANPENDAALMETTLTKLGFRVIRQGNLDRKGLFDSINSFADKLPQGSAALVYFAGHGLQISGNNYLLPVDLIPTSEVGISLRAYPVKSLLERLAVAKSAVNLVVLDACRNNPFQPASRTRGFDQLGLKRIAAPRGTLIAYATAPGQLADDGIGRKNSRYTEALAQAIPQRGKPIELILREVGEQVRGKTLDDQQPWFESSLVDDFYFLPPDGVQIAPGKSLKLAKAETGTMLRGTRGQSAVNDSAWYMALSEREWTELDWEIQQRVKRLTSDEIPMLKHRAKGGNVVAMTTLGLAYKEGIERAANPSNDQVMRYGAKNTEALKWLRMAAQAGFPLAQVELGEMYFSGHGVDRNLNESGRWLELAGRVNLTRAKLDLVHWRVASAPNDENTATAPQELLKTMGLIFTPASTGK